MDRWPRVAVYTAPEVSAEDRRAMSESLGAEVAFVDAGPNARHADMILSIGGEWQTHAEIAAWPLTMRRRWLHFARVADVTLDAIWSCALVSLLGDPAKIRTDTIPLDAAYMTDDDAPLVSVFTTTYRSGERIMRPLRSLQQQSYTNWEWVVLDDSGDDGATFFGALAPLAPEPRVRTYYPRRASGFIGEVKRHAASLCRGKILLELDHDDELEPDCLAHLVEAFRRYPDAGFVYMDGCEVIEDAAKTNWAYPEFFGRGHGAYYRQYSVTTQTWVNAIRMPDLNAVTLRDIVGVPNHPRAWRADFYALVGGHCAALPVADDYELVLRTFLRAPRLVRVPTLAYIQYRNRGGNNFTFLRNDLIRRLQARLAGHYSDAIDRRLTALDLPRALPVPEKPIWLLPEDAPLSLRHADARTGATTTATADPHLRGSVLVLVSPSGAARGGGAPPLAIPDDCELVLVAWGGANIDEPMRTHKYFQRLSAKARRRVRWWSLSAESDRATALAYARYIAGTAQEQHHVIDWCAVLNELQ